MLAYGSTTSPSLKMESGYGNGYTSQRAASFSVGRIIGDPFALATISIGIVSTAYQEPPRTVLTAAARLGHCLCLQHNIRHPRRLPQLRMVDPGLHVLLHRRCHSDRRV